MAQASIRNLVRVTGERNGIVEFEYGVGDMSLAIELMLPPLAFDEFCRTNAVEFVAEPRRDGMSEEERSMTWLPSDVQRHI